MQLWSKRSAAFAALLLAASLCGCANPDAFDSNQRWFARPFDWTGRQGGYAFSELKETNDNRRPVTANDLVAANGACPPAPVAAAPSPSAGELNATAPAPAPSLLGGGIALGMTECEVVYRAGAPSAVQVGSKPNGDRTAVLTYNSGPRPGIYRFEAGRLTDMDRAEAPAAEPKVAKRTKKEPARAEAQRVSTE